MKTILVTLFLLILLPDIYSQIGGYALNFDGEKAVDCGTDASLNITGTAISVEAWVYPTAFSTNYWENVIVNKLSNTSHGFNLRCGGNGIVEFYAAYDFVTLNNVISDPSTLTLNKWTHLAGTYDGSTVKLYVNGKLVKSSTSTSSIASTNLPLVIGNSGNGELTQPFIGSIDDVRIWNIVRTEAEIKANMYKEIGTHENLKAYYTMSNGTGTSLTDNSGNSNTGTLTNGPTWKASGCFAGPRQALDFDGVDDYVNCGTSLTSDLVGTNIISVEAWVNLTAYNSAYHVLPTVVGNYDNGQMQFLLRIDANKPTFWINFNYLRGVNDLPLDKWTHLAASWDGTVMKIYVNGILENSGNYSGTFLNTLYPVKIGLNFNNERWQGKIDEVRIWKVVRTDSQIRENMMSNLVGNESGLAAYYRMDYNDGTTLYDVASNGYNGTLNNMDPATDWVASDAFNTWIGSESSEFLKGANWSSGSAPGGSFSNSGIYKWEGGNDLSFGSGLEKNPTVNHIFFSSNANPNLNSNFDVEGNLLLGKNLDLNGRQIYLGTSGYLVEGDYRLYGNTGTITTSRSLSGLTSLTNIAGLGFSVKINSGSLDDNTTITRGHTEQTNGGLIYNTKRFYDITASGTYNLDISFMYNQNELGGGSENDLRLYKSTDGGTTWTKQVSASFNITDNTFSLSGVTSMSQWTTADNSSPLPVELNLFTAAISGNNVILNWQTATEVNNFGFEIERSQMTEDGSQIPPAAEEWSKIGFVAGSGNSNSPKEYSFTDEAITEGKYSYRLKQIDNDGKFTYSEEIEVELLRPLQFELSQNYPNPFNPSTTIKFGLPVDTRVTLEVFNVTGEKVSTLINNEMRYAGYHEVQFNASDLSSGVYFCRIKAGSFVSVKKLTLMK